MGCAAARGSVGKTREGSVAPARDEEEARQSSALASARERKQTSRQSCERAEREQQHVGRPTSITSDSKVMRPYEQRADKQGRQGSRCAVTGWTAMSRAEQATAFQSSKELVLALSFT